MRYKKILQQEKDSDTMLKGDLRLHECVKQACNKQEEEDESVKVKFLLFTKNLRIQRNSIVLYRMNSTTLTQPLLLN